MKSNGYIIKQIKIFKGLSFLAIDTFFHQNTLKFWIKKAKFLVNNKNKNL